MMHYLPTSKQPVRERRLARLNPSCVSSKDQGRGAGGPSRTCIIIAIILRGMQEKILLGHDKGVISYEAQQSMSNPVDQEIGVGIPFVDWISS
jgi:hypothetical protein